MRAFRRLYSHRKDAAQRRLLGTASRQRARSGESVTQERRCDDAGGEAGDLRMDRSKLPANVCVADDVKLGENVRLAPFVNLYGCEVGDDTRIGTFVEIQKQARVGKRCKISSHTFI